MNELDWDDPAVDKHWCDERRREVIAYLAREKVEHGAVGVRPAWHVTPYVSVWSVESLLTPGRVGWWAICGDLPNDYLSADTVKQPREALLAFADVWKNVAEAMQKGQSHPHISIGTPEDQSELAPLLKSRSDALRRFAEDGAMWEMDGS
jgi:hypothetical protein